MLLLRTKCCIALPNLLDLLKLRCHHSMLAAHRQLALTSSLRRRPRVLRSRKRRGAGSTTAARATAAAIDSFWCSTTKLTPSAKIQGTNDLQRSGHYVDLCVGRGLLFAAPRCGKTHKAGVQPQLAGIASDTERPGRCLTPAIHNFPPPDTTAQGSPPLNLEKASSSVCSRWALPTPYMSCSVQLGRVSQPLRSPPCGMHLRQATCNKQNSRGKLLRRLPHAPAPAHKPCPPPPPLSSWSCAPRRTLHRSQHRWRWSPSRWRPSGCQSTASLQGHVAGT
jgi:hypothetical protein